MIMQYSVVKRNRFKLYELLYSWVARPAVGSEGVDAFWGEVHAGEHVWLSDGSHPYPGELLHLLLPLRQPASGHRILRILLNHWQG